jgi:phospholipase/carboxylesterase
VDEELVRLGLKPGALAMMGFSQGAMTALHAALRRPVAPRAVLSYSGALMVPQGILVRPPVLLVHGEADEVVPAFRSRDAEAALREAGVPVESLFCPGLGHGIDEAGLSRGALFLQRAFANDA